MGINIILSNKDFKYGLRRGLPITIGYIPVAITFGLMAVSGGLPPWIAVFISLSNLTSAGQFAGTNLIIQGAGYFEITMTTLIINIRYLLMSLSLSQRIDPKISLKQRLIFGFGITDETFSVASVEKGRLSYAYMVGLIIGPIIGWTLGTALGATISSALKPALGDAMGIALYAMFIAIIIPPAKKSQPIFIIIIISILITILLRYIPVFGFISSGFRVIIATVIAAAIGAAIWPINPENNC